MNERMVALLGALRWLAVGMALGMIWGLFTADSVHDDLMNIHVGLFHSKEVVLLHREHDHVAAPAQQDEEAPAE